MNREEFIKYIESIGFEYDKKYDKYEYKEIRVSLWNKYYTSYNGSEWVKYDYNDLTPLLKITRSIKLKELLR